MRIRIRIGMGMGMGMGTMIVQVCKVAKVGEVDVLEVLEEGKVRYGVCPCCGGCKVEEVSSRRRLGAVER